MRALYNILVEQICLTLDNEACLLYFERWPLPVLHMTGHARNGPVVSEASLKPRLSKSKYTEEGIHISSLALQRPSKDKAIQLPEICDMIVACDARWAMAVRRRRTEACVRADEGKY
eukprot:6213387-Pleurochrysis_carterae.AAC.1